MTSNAATTFTASQDLYACVLEDYQPFGDKPSYWIEMDGGEVVANALTEDEAHQEAHNWMDLPAFRAVRWQVAGEPKATPLPSFKK